MPPPYSRRGPDLPLPARYPSSAPARTQAHCRRLAYRTSGSAAHQGRRTYGSACCYSAGPYDGSRACKRGRRNETTACRAGDGRHGRQCDDGRDVDERGPWLGSSTPLRSQLARIAPPQHQYIQVLTVLGNGAIVGARDKFVRLDTHP